MIERKSSTGVQSDPFEEQRLYNQANIAVTIDANNVVQVYTGIGNSKTLVTGISGNGLSANAYQAAQSSITTNSFIQDNREQANVRVVNFDVAEFMKKFPTSFPSSTLDWNGIIYLTDTRSGLLSSETSVTFWLSGGTAASVLSCSPCVVRSSNLCGAARGDWSISPNA